MLLPMKESKRKRYYQGLFAFLVIAITLSGLLRTAFWPKDVNTYESRNANKPAAFTVGNYLSGVFQNSMEKALADQVPFAQYFKKTFNILRFQYYRFMLLPKAERHPELCFHYKGIGLIDGYMVHKPADLSENTEIMLSLAHKRADDMRACREINPETEYYLYYIESDRDYDFETAEKKDTYGFITENMEIPADRTGRLCVDNLEDYKKIYFKTDHHWNCYGAYEGYRGLMTLLGVEEKLLEPVETASDPLWWAGSKAAEVGFREYKEPFPICRYEYPPMEIFINGSPSDMLEPQEAFFSGDMESISYGDYYGGIEGEVILDTNRPERKNILLLGDSFDNAIRKLVASHFNKTFSVDERTYEEDRGEPFILAEYVRKNDIDIVVYDGDILAFSGDAFL